MFTLIRPDYILKLQLLSFLNRRQGMFQFLDFWFSVFLVTGGGLCIWPFRSVLSGSQLKV